MITIDGDTAKRFVLGKQGLWPGRRWRGPEGVAQAMRAGEYLQLDPLQIIARSHDIQLHSRVLDYSPGMWEQATYGRRQFFDWGGWLAVRPMDELPYWRVAMRRERDGLAGDGRIHLMAHEHAAAIAEMRAILGERGTVSNRDFSMAARTRTNSYRGRKDSSLALYYLWRTGEVMTHHRERFERVYALTEAVAPAHLNYESSEAEADRFIMLKEIGFSGLWRMARTAEAYHRGAASVLDGGKPVLEKLVNDGGVIVVQVEGWKGLYYASAGDAALLDELSAGRIPQAWQPIGPTTAEECVILAPLDPVSARGRAKPLFGFEYVWEVYKPERLRKYGYYTLPILWGEQLVARFDSKLDRTTNTLVILGLWLEDEALANNAAFVDAFTRGFARFAAFLGAGGVDATRVQATALKKALAGNLITS